MKGKCDYTSIVKVSIVLTSFFSNFDQDAVETMKVLISTKTFQNMSEENQKFLLKAG